MFITYEISKWLSGLNISPVPKRSSVKRVMNNVAVLTTTIDGASVNVVIQICSSSMNRSRGRVYEIRNVDAHDISCTYHLQYDLVQW